MAVDKLAQPPAQGDAQGRGAIPPSSAAPADAARGYWYVGADGRIVDPEGEGLRELVEAFLRGLRATGFVVGR